MSTQWMYRDDETGMPHQRDSYCANMCHPVVVISPGDREAVGRLAAVLREFGGGGAATRNGRLAAALREFANPKPEEPTDPKARVIDRRDNTRRLLADGEWICVDGPDIGTYVTWARLLDDFAPLRVLSEGVQ